MLSLLEMDRLLEIYVFASSGIVLSPIEITTFSKIASLHHSEILLSPMERSQLLKIYVFTSSELVLSTAAMHHSWHRISCNAEHLKKSLPDQCWEPISAFRNASKTAPAAVHHSWHRTSCIANHLKKSLPDQCWEADFCISKCKRNSTLNHFQY